MEPYAARLEVDYPEELDRVSTFFRIVWAIPILILSALISGTGSETITTVSDTGETLSQVTRSGGGITGGIFVATALMLVIRRKYPRWWFDFLLEFERFSARVGAYMGLLTDQYPSTTDEQAVHLDVDYPEDPEQLNQWLPLVKWFLAIPHYIVLAFLAVFAILGVLVAWFAILFTGKYPRAIFDFVVGVARWALRVQAYAFFLVTDEYPPFSLT